MSQHTCIVLNTNNTIEIKKMDHKRMYNTLGDFTFVGAIPEFNAFALGLKSSNDIINSFCKHGKNFETNIHGKVILIGSDKYGNAMDLHENIVEYLKNDTTIITKF